MNCLCFIKYHQESTNNQDILKELFRLYTESLQPNNAKPNFKMDKCLNSYFSNGNRQVSNTRKDVQYPSHQGFKSKPQ